MRISKPDKLKMLMAIMKMAEVTKNRKTPAFSEFDIQQESGVIIRKVCYFLNELASYGPVLREHNSPSGVDYSIDSLYLLACEIEYVTSPRSPKRPAPKWAHLMLKDCE